MDSNRGIPARPRHDSGRYIYQSLGSGAHAIIMHRTVTPAGLAASMCATIGVFAFDEHFVKVMSDTGAAFVVPQAAHCQRMGCGVQATGLHNVYALALHGLATPIRTLRMLLSRGVMRSTPTHQVTTHEL